MAFPTTSLLDDFDRANSNLNAGNWAAPIFSGDSTLAITSNQCCGASGFCSSYWAASTFGPDSECYAVLPVVPASANGVEVFCRITNPDSGNENNYFLHVQKAAGTDSCQLWKTVGHTQTQLGASASQEVSAGESVGIEAIGTAITFYRKSSGTWASVFSRTDSSVTGAGYVGLVIQNAVARFDDFSGGTVVAAGAGHPTMRRWGGSISPTGAQRFGRSW
jgi:hypothetical protein